jgi:hypothetical protein
MLLAAYADDMSEREVYDEVVAPIANAPRRASADRVCDERIIAKVSKKKGNYQYSVEGSELVSIGVEYIFTRNSHAKQKIPHEVENKLRYTLKYLHKENELH